MVSFRGFGGFRGEELLGHVTPLTNHPRGVQVLVRAIPRAGRSGIAGTRGDAILVRLAAAPVDGAANDELVAVLAKALDLPARHFSIVGGQHLRQKRVLIEGASLADVQARLSNILGQA